MTSDTYLLEIKQMTKSYGNLFANIKVDLKIKQGEIHAVLGENGSGKTTIVNILAGLKQMDSGTLYWNNKVTTINSPIESSRLGIGVVFQHFSLFESFNVLENIALGISYKGNLETLRLEIIQLSKNYQLNIDPDKQISELSTGGKQRVEIVRCLLQKPKLLIMDEPTSTLSPGECEQLFKILNQCCENGCSVLFISHKLDEVKRVCNQATILRLGKVITTIDVESTSIQEIVYHVVGENDTNKWVADKTECYSKKNILEVRNITTDFGLPKVQTFKVKEGMILGIAGVSGNGQDKIMDTLSGVFLGSSDSVKFDNQRIGRMNLIERRKLGILNVPTERIGRSMVGEMSLQENILLCLKSQDSFVKKGLIIDSKIQSFAKIIIEKFSVKVSNESGPSQHLSGGNIQKFVMGRAILQEPKLLLVSNPTWGIDIKSSLVIHKELINLRNAGATIVISSENLVELFALCDELVVMREGSISKAVKVEKTSFKEVCLMMMAS